MSDDEKASIARLFLHNYPAVQDLIAGQSNAAQYAVSDDCGTQVMNWNSVTPNGAYFQGALTLVYMHVERPVAESQLISVIWSVVSPRVGKASCRPCQREEGAVNE